MAMHKRTWLNLGLAAILVALVLLAVYEPGKAPPPEPKRLTDLKVGEITRLRIERPEGKPIAFERQDGSWRMISPVTATAGEQRLDAVTRIVESETTATYDAAGLDLAAYGLDKPLLRLVVNDELTLLFGANTPLDQKRYMQIGDKVHVINDLYYYRLAGDYPRFLSNRLLEEGQEPAAIRLPTLTLTKEEGRWRAEPQPDDYSADAAVALADAWRQASAIDVKPYNGAKGEEVQVSVAGREAPIRFLVTARDPDLILARPDLGIQYNLVPESAERLLELKAPEPLAENEPDSAQ